MLTPEQGATAALRLATEPDLRSTTGAYFKRDTPTATPPISYDRGARAKLWATSARHFGLSI